MGCSHDGRCANAVCRIAGDHSIIHSCAARLIPHELVKAAKLLGHSAIAVTDRNSLAGVVKAYDAARQAGIKFITGCRLDLTDGRSLLCYPQEPRRL